MPFPVVCITFSEVDYEKIHLFFVFAVEAFESLSGYSRYTWCFIIIQLTNCASEFFHPDVGVQLGRLISLADEFSGVCEAFSFIVVHFC